ncbi:MAG: DUF6115 domain-containing protein [Salinispira sp.]
MDFILLLLINISVLALIYLALRHSIQRRYNSEGFLTILQKEVHGVMTDLNQTVEMNVQIINNEAEKLQALQKKVERRIEDLQQIFQMLERSDKSYDEILEKKRAITRRGSGIHQHTKEPGGPMSDHQETQKNKQPNDQTNNQTNNQKNDTKPEAEHHARGNSGISVHPADHTQILGLYSQGRSIQEIAKLTQLPAGEVELIIEFST